MQEKHAALVLRGVIWVLLLISFILIMTGSNNAGLVLAAASLIFNLALQRDSVRKPLIALLTGQSKE